MPLNDRHVIDMLEHIDIKYHQFHNNSYSERYKI